KDRAGALDHQQALDRLFVERRADGAKRTVLELQQKGRLIGLLGGQVDLQQQFVDLVLQTARTDVELHLELRRLLLLGQAGRRVRILERQVADVLAVHRQGRLARV